MVKRTILARFTLFFTQSLSRTRVKGFVGRVIRVAGQQRVALEIKSICYLATAFVPSAFLEKVGESSGIEREGQRDAEESVV